jgi:hypothetical protein
MCTSLETRFLTSSRWALTVGALREAVELSTRKMDFGQTIYDDAFSGNSFMFPSRNK